MPEEEIMTNPKAEDMCEYEEKNYPKCKECPRTIDDQIYCKLNQINWNLTQIKKKLEEKGG